MPGTEALTAAAAVIAAALSALTLFFTGRRETRKWLREQLLDAEVEFLDASFTYPGRQLYAAIGDLPVDAIPSQTIDLSSFWADYRTAHEAQNTALTRIRLVAGKKVVEAAENLHDLDEHISLHLLEDKPYMGSNDFKKLRERQRIAREAFIDAARKDVKLKGGTVIRSSDVNRDETLPVSGSF